MFWLFITVGPTPNLIVQSNPFIILLDSRCDIWQGRAGYLVAAHGVWSFHWEIFRHWEIGTTVLWQLLHSASTETAEAGLIQTVNQMCTCGLSVQFQPLHRIDSLNSERTHQENEYSQTATGYTTFFDFTLTSVMLLWWWSVGGSSSKYALFKGRNIAPISPWDWCQKFAAMLQNCRMTFCIHCW